MEKPIVYEAADIVLGLRSLIEADPSLGDNADVDANYLYMNVNDANDVYITLVMANGQKFKVRVDPD